MSIIHKLNEQIKELQNKIKLIQAQCSHPESALKKEYRSDTGNYDPTADSSWTKYTCELCERVWTKENE